MINDDDIKRKLYYSTEGSFTVLHMYMNGTVKNQHRFVRETIHIPQGLMNINVVTCGYKTHVKYTEMHMQQKVINPFLSILHGLTY